MLADPLLALLVPSAGALLIALASRLPNLRETITLATSGLLVAVVASLVPQVLDGGRPAVHLATMLPGLVLELRVEPLGMLFALVAAVLWVVNSLYSIGYMRANKEQHQTRFYVCFAIALASTMGIAFAANLLTLFLFYEVLTLCTYPLVTHHGTPASRSGGILAGKTGAVTTGVLLALFMFGIGKAALMPVHRWLPAAMVAPTPVSALLHAVAVVKAGVFSVVKVIVYVFGVDLLAGLATAAWLPVIAGLTIVLASLTALRSDNLKRRLAYSTVSQLSYVVLAAALLTPRSVMAAALHIAAHAVAKITLFFAAGAIYTAAHKTEVSELAGIGRRMPITMAAFTIGALSMVGVPPTAGFLSKWYLLGGAMAQGQYAAVAVIALSTLLNAAYFMPIVYMAFFRAPVADGQHAYGEAPAPMLIALALTATATVALFAWPDLALQLAAGLVGG
ncbi:MAG: monovalent cation/H+ antiporter subunit D family protein [Gammaproteobacteria bacterium]|nr:monovalent cation/H+ antiporter subunit D family protein [Gammaproteobacteria bacterium]